MEKQKNAITLILASAVAAAFAMFLRWFEIQTTFDRETGLFERGFHIQTVIFLVYMIACAVCAYIVVRRIGKKGLGLYFDERATADEGMVIRIIMYVLAALMTLSSIKGILQASTIVSRVFAAVSIFGGIFLAARLNSKLRFLGKISDCVLLLTSMLWVINIYWQNKNNPAVWSFAAELVGACVIIIFIIGTANFRFTGGGTYCIFLSAITVPFCGAALGENAEGANMVLFIIMAACALCYTYVFMMNLSDADAIAAEKAAKENSEDNSNSEAEEKEQEEEPSQTTEE